VKLRHQNGVETSAYLKERRRAWHLLSGLLLLFSFSASAASSFTGIDGAVIGWGRIQLPYVEPSVRFTNVAAGGAHNLALKPDGTVVAWGANDHGQTTVPASLTGIVAVATGYQHSLALTRNGTVVAWGNNDYGQASVPATLSAVQAIVAGGQHSLARRTDGTVVAWGDNTYGQSAVPSRLSGVVAIAAGFQHSLALTSDGPAGTTRVECSPCPPRRTCGAEAPSSEAWFKHAN
jgi:alpha-tubulin suppressor-like RCC1 family protein